MAIFVKFNMTSAAISRDPRFSALSPCLCAVAPQTSCDRCIEISIRGDLCFFLTKLGDGAPSTMDNRNNLIIFVLDVYIHTVVLSSIIQDKSKHNIVVVSAGVKPVADFNAIFV
jgi:hypothetical protein